MRKKKYMDYSGKEKRSKAQNEGKGSYTKLLGRTK